MPSKETSSDSFDWARFQSGFVRQSDGAFVSITRWIFDVLFDGIQKRTLDLLWTIEVVYNTVRRPSGNRGRPRAVLRDFESSNADFCIPKIESQCYINPMSLHARDRQTSIHLTGKRNIDLWPWGGATMTAAWEGRDL